MITVGIPADGIEASSYVERSITVAGSKIVRSASAPTLMRPFFVIAGVRFSSRRAGRARVPSAVFDEAVARDQRERAGDCRAGLLFGTAVDDYGAAGRPGLLE